MSKARNLGNIVSGTTSTIENSVLKIKGDGSSADAKLTLNCSQNSHGVSIQAPPHSAGQSYVLILPQNTGTNGQVLATNGNSTNQLSWIDAAVLPEQDLFQYPLLNLSMVQQVLLQMLTQFLLLTLQHYRLM